MYYPQDIKKNGFTFIELLIVITILAILFVLVFVSLQSVQKKTQNTRVKNDVRQLRLLAEEVFDNAGADYQDWTQNPLVLNHIATLRNDIAKVNHEVGGQTASSVIVDTHPEGYCISGKLLVAENEATHFCVDSTAVFRLTHSHCTDGGLALPLACPN